METKESMKGSGQMAIQSFGELVLLLRRRKRMSQKELALEAGITAGYLCKIENDQADPTLDVVQRIFQVLGYTVWFQLNELTGQPVGMDEQHQAAPARMLQ